MLCGSGVPQYPLVVQHGAFLYQNNTTLGLFATSLGQQIRAARLRGRALFKETNPFYS